MFQHILIPTDGSTLSTTAIQNAMQLARDAKAKVTVITVMEPFHIFSMDSVQLANTRSAYAVKVLTHSPIPFRLSLKSRR